MFGNDGVCGLCNEPESINHLSFDCYFAEDTLRKVLNWLMFDRKSMLWEEEPKWMCSELFIRI